MKHMLMFGALLTAATAVFGQGQFLFNTRDPSAGNDVKFGFLGTPLSGPDLFLQVLAGPDANDLQPVIGTFGGPLPFNGTGADAGYANPFSDTYTVPVMSEGQEAVVGYTVFRGTDFATGDHILPVTFARGLVTLTEPPRPPNEVALGVLEVMVPEPSTGALGLLASAVVLVMSWQKSRAQNGAQKHAIG